MQLSVIIVNYNVKYFLEQCLHSVQKACTGIDAEIIVVDNHSNDGSRVYLADKFPGVRFIWNSVNEGFSKANNKALETAGGEFILFLNPDTLLSEDSIATCIQFFRDNKIAGAVGIRMIDGSGKFLKESKRAFPSPLTSLFKLCGLAALFPRSTLFARYHLGHLPENKTQEVDVLAGAFMMVPKKVLDEIGNFDERFFMYGEDVDLSYRIQKAGYKNYYVATSSIIHFKGESTKRGSLNYVRLFYQAMNLFVKKHYSGSKAGIFIFLIQTAIFIRACFSAIGHGLKKMGLPILDAIIILAACWISKYFWSHYIRQEVDYSPNVLLIAFPAFTGIFLLVSYYAGLYDKGYKQARLIRSAGIAALVLMSIYGLLPESIRFSRGILIMGILTALLLMNAIRYLFIQWHYLETGDEHEEKRQTIIVAGEKDGRAIENLMKSSGIPDRVLGRVTSGADEIGSALGSIQNLPELVKKYPVREVIFCANGLGFKDIFNIIGNLPKTIRNKFYASGSHSIVGSDSKDIAGEFLAVTMNYEIDNPINRRNKRLVDVVTALFFTLFFPIFIFLKKGALSFYKNVVMVLLGKKTWVGYAIAPNALPEIRNAVITSTSLPVVLNTLPVEGLNKTDEWYAKNYSVMLDLKLIRKGFKYLHQ